MEKMKRIYNILFLENEFIGRNSSGGVMTYMNNLTSYYQSQGLEYRWLTCMDDSSNAYGIMKIANRPISNVSYVLRLFVWAVKNKIDKNTIIHSNRADYLLPFIIFHRKTLKVCTVHGMHDFCFSMKKGKFLGFIYNLVYGFCIKNSHRVISVDEGTTKKYIQKYGMTGGEITTIPIGVNFNQFKPIDKSKAKSALGLNENIRYVVYIGRLEYEKNLMFLLDSYKELTNSLDDVCLLLIGAGSWKSRLEDKIKEHNLVNVRFINEVDYSEIPLWINASEMLVLCSLYEGSPTVIRESLACNVPIVSLDVGDVRKVISNIGDRYISDNHPKVFAAKMKEMIETDHPDFRSLINDYSADTMGARTVGEYEHLIGSNNDYRS
jgi:glycosyltransferase involved in cell wall biosynthesis